MGFYKKFLPTKEERIKFLKNTVELYKRNIGKCLTCTHYDQIEQNCEVSEDLFYRKSYDTSKTKCPAYDENKKIVTLLENEIKILEGE